MAMTAVTEIETVDGEYCFSLRDAGGQDFVLFGFSTQGEAEIARKAVCQIVDHASVILPIAQSPAAAADLAPSAEDSDSANPFGDTGADGKLEATSPFSK